MGKITIHCTHDWIVEPSGRSVSKKQPVELKARSPTQVRITVPKSVAQLVKEYNGCQPGKVRDILHAKCMDTLAKLQVLILSSAIYDSARKDSQQLSNLSKTKYDSLSIRDPNTLAQARAKDKTRQFAAEARVSLVLLSKCNSKIIRDKSWLLLAEALDINHLSLIDNEIVSLQMLWIELIQVLRQIIEARRQELQMGDEKSFWQNGINAAQCVESIITNALDTRIIVDDTLLSILICISQTARRISYIEDMNKRIQMHQIVLDSYENLIEDLKLLRTEDPYAINLISIIDSDMKLKLEGFKEQKPLYFNYGISMLSNILQMTPQRDVAIWDATSRQVLMDLQESKKILEGKKFLEILAACALINTDALSSYIHVLKGLIDQQWEWVFSGVLFLGSIACSSSSSKICQAAISEGLLFFAACDHLDDSCADKWKIRYSALLALTEVFQHFYNEPHGVLAREVLANSRDKPNNHPIITALLEKQITRIMQPQFVRKTHFLFKYCCMNLADNFSDGLRDYKSLKKYSKLKNFYFDPTGVSRKKVQLDPDLLVETLEKKFANLQTQELSLQPYHHNYKKIQFDPDRNLGENVALYFEQSTCKKLPDHLTPSVLGDRKLDLTCTYDIGTANKRKVFRAEK